MADDSRLEKMLDDAGRGVQPAHPGWQKLAERLAGMPQAGPPGWQRWWWVPAPVAVAAGVALWLTFWGGPNTPIGPGPAKGNEPPPIRVERQDVDLTILSVAETEGETLYMPLIEMLGRKMMANPVAEAAATPGIASRRGLAMAPYQPGAARRETGQALVKDHRLVLNLREGENIVRFADVAATIDPTSVRLHSDTDPDGTVVLEQNFEYDLVNADALLKRYVDRQISCVFKDGHETAGYLAAYDEQAIVLASEAPAPSTKKTVKQPSRTTQSLNRRKIQAVRLKEVPSGLLVKPTLVWKLRARQAGKNEVTVSYLCGLMKWQTDYVVLVTPGEAAEPDRLDVTGWVTLDNASGATFDKAGLKLIAGDLNRVRDPWAAPELAPRQDPMMAWGMLNEKNKAMDGAQKKEFVEKSFFEYHLYTLTAPSTVRDQETKQLNLVQRTGVKADRRYLFDPNVDARRCAIELIAKNDKENHLGLPLPKGRVTFEQRDVDGEAEFLGRTAIDHTAVKEELTLRYGFAFDVVGEFRQVNYQQPNPRMSIVTNEMRIRNHKSAPAQVRAVAHLGTNWKVTQSTLPYLQHDFQTVHFDFKLPADAEQVITYTVEYQY